MDEKIGVVFDTNAYRNFVRDLEIDQVSEAVQKLRQKENEAGVKTYGSVIVGLELLAHLVEGDCNFDECIKAIIALGTHCVDKESGWRIIPDARLHVIGIYFKDSPEKEELESKALNIGGVISDVGKNHEDNIENHRLRGTFKNIKNYIDIAEKDFLKTIKYLLFFSKTFDIIDNCSYINKSQRDLIKNELKKSNSYLKEKQLKFFNGKEFETLSSYCIIKYLSEHLNQKNNGNEIIRKSRSVVDEFPLFFGFLKSMLIKIVEDNVDIKSKKTKQKRANWIWDYNISFHISDKTLDGRKSIIITSDKDMTDILRKNSYEDRVMSLKEYFEFVKYK